MGMNIEFYSADPKELVSLFVKQKENHPDFFQKLQSYPMADFSLHLLLPDDMDSFCKYLNKQNRTIPQIFRSLLVKQLYFADNSQSLTLINEKFTKGIAAMTQNDIEKVATEWANPFLYGKPLKESAPYGAVLSLYKVAKESVIQEKPLILHLLG